MSRLRHASRRFHELLPDGRCSRAAWWLFLLCLGACGAPPAPAGAGSSAKTASVVRRAPGPDDCLVEPGKPPPEPLLKVYTGVAAKARCQREVYTIMGGVTHFLGVECKHCHLEPDYAAMTHQKEVANWMARELVPRLQERASSGLANGEVWCNDCHKGKAKFLGNPRDPGFVTDWMTVHLVEEFDTSLGKPLACRDCHQGDLGSPEFQRKIILTGNLPEGRALPPVEPPTSPPLPDYGGR